MSHENLTTIGAALQTEYQAWLAQSVISWPEQFRQVSDDWDVLRRLNAELAETLQPIQECIELDSWLASGFFALPMTSPAPEPNPFNGDAMGTMATPETGLPHALPPLNGAMLPESSFAPAQIQPVSDRNRTFAASSSPTNSMHPGRYTQEKEAILPPETTPAAPKNPVKMAGSGLRDLARLAQSAPISDDVPNTNEQPSLSAPGFLAEESETPKLPANFFGDIPAEYPQSTQSVDFDQREGNATTNAGVSPNLMRNITTPANPSVKAAVPSMASGSSFANPQPVMPAPSFEQAAAESLTPASLLQLTRELAQAASEETVPAAAAGAYRNPPPADVDFAAATQMPIDFQRVLMALPFGNASARAELSNSASARDGQAAVRRRSAAPGAQDAPAIHPETEPALIVERRVQAAQNVPPSSIESQIDMRDLLDTLSQEIWREYQRYYGR